MLLSHGTHFVSWGEQVATVKNSDSRVVTAELQVSSGDFQCCRFSPNGKFVAGGVGCAIYVWDITSLNPHLVETLVGHTEYIVSLTFSSSLISVSRDKTVKFWQINTTSTDLVTTDITSTPLSPSSIQSVNLQAKDGVVISSDLAGVVKIWDILTGLCKASFQTPAKGVTWRDAQLIKGRLITVWHADQGIHILDAGTGEFLHVVDAPEFGVTGLRISGDGSKVFCLTGKSIIVWLIQTGKVVGRVELYDFPSLDPLHMGGSKIWVSFQDSSTQGWDFGVLHSSPSKLSNTFPDRPRLNFVSGWGSSGPSMIRDTVTGTEIFHLVGRYGNPTKVQWDGQYLVAGYRSGEVLILDFNHAFLQ